LFAAFADWNKEADENDGQNGKMPHRRYGRFQKSEPALWIPLMSGIVTANFFPQRARSLTW